MYTVDELKALTSDTGVSTLFTFDMVLPNIRPLCREVDIARVVVTRVTDYIEGFGQSTPEELELEEGWHHFSLLLETASGTRLPRIEILQDDLAQGCCSHPRESGSGHYAVLPVGFRFYRFDVSRETQCNGASAFLPCIWNYRGIKLGHV
jgi:hypothetical protein